MFWLNGLTVVSLQAIDSSMVKPLRMISKRRRDIVNKWILTSF